jgi:hypothetical protein
VLEHITFTVAKPNKDARKSDINIAITKVSFLSEEVPFSTAIYKI